MPLFALCLLDMLKIEIFYTLQSIGMSLIKNNLFNEIAVFCCV